jgi:hypothetical protein
MRSRVTTISYSGSCSGAAEPRRARRPQALSEKARKSRRGRKDMVN